MRINNKYHALKTVFRLVEEMLGQLRRLLLRCTSRVQLWVCETTERIDQLFDFNIKAVGAMKFARAGSRTCA
jgi:hypothetical protein